jgi:hypothetical protein
MAPALLTPFILPRVPQAITGERLLPRNPFRAESVSSHIEEARTARVARPAERRSSPRVKGRQVRVHVVCAATSGEALQGWVLDRSCGGLGLWVPAPVAEGASLLVRAAGSADAVPVEVCNCRADGDRWVLGCRFLRSPRWEVMLQFC